IFQDDDSWDADVITFTADCTDCSVAKNDSYRFVTGTTGPVPLDIGANDDPTSALDNTNTTLALDGDDAIDGDCAGGLTDFGPGD
ncbi:hypothetical protein, partial [Escherichia coli]|uniref:hypothetical protein n=1 Tax=Escherichia coli TaxID=562 RepID=UPI0014128702